jgi:hypothetical protein
VLATIKMGDWIKQGLAAQTKRSLAVTAMQAVRRGKVARQVAAKRRKVVEEKKAAEEAARKAAADAEAARIAAESADAAAKAELERKAAEAAVAAEKAVAEVKAAEQSANEAVLESEEASRVTAVAVKAAEAEAVRRRSVLQTPTILEEDEEGFDEKWFISVGEKGASKEYHRYLMCKGVEWGFQYHNFYGDWEISATQPVCNSRPHYVHNTMYGGHAHLFHTLDPHYHVPRWVIGPAPGNENGWAFAESDAATPDKVTATWISWDGFEWHSCKSFRFICKEHELDGLSEDEDVEQVPRPKLRSHPHPHSHSHPHPHPRPHPRPRPSALAHNPT